MNRVKTAAEVMAIMETLAPAALAESWDRIGLQIGDPAQPVKSVLLVLDVTPQVIARMNELPFDMIICHHPAIFNPLEHLRLDDPQQNLLIELAGRKISVLAAHTNLDAAPGGVADVLAEQIARAAVGLINPAGENGLGESLSDIHTEYFPVTATDEARKYGRLINLGCPVSLQQLTGRIKRDLRSGACRLNTDCDRPVARLAIFPGSFPGEAAADLILAKADCLICGEYKYHDGLAIGLSGVAAVGIGHDSSEQVVLLPLAEKLAGKLPELTFAVSPGMDYNKIAF
ncbi:MAG: Nif3-like dinuclear metal center hexameric protein [Clostridiaceae bacterium]|nr:Nif3-like dinuclear metal center hexameric protein [Clostridiaceae bacterium]